MTKQCHHHFLVNQEKGEKRVFRKSKKYRTLCSVALGTLATAIVAWNGNVSHADEVTAPLDNAIQRTENPATNLQEAQPNAVSEQAGSLEATGQSEGALSVTVPHDTVTNAVEAAQVEGVTTVQDSPMDLGNTTSASETTTQLDKAEADAAKQVQAITSVTESYKTEKATYEAEKNRVETHNSELTSAYDKATQAGNVLNQAVDAKVSELDKSKVSIATETVTSGDGKSVSGYTDYVNAISLIDQQNKDNLADYLAKKKQVMPLLKRISLFKKKMKQVLQKSKQKMRLSQSVIKLVRKPLMRRMQQVKQRLISAIKISKIQAMRRLKPS
ncbi:putative cross-wall-targeting lipoprotein signal [Streptococcus ictaluri 707-05]|uniref:Cross-wall-targeting lipoprotein signal n=1 Tax=Streptococcus ictaluri 707-05 TaxID=764299 RepID=G5K328_9STRE|nr:putative cross-wall-targeting lipoprotein signal [Streptococcus ictaluri 707-05]